MSALNASTQYNDFIGTSAADISDHIKLKDFLKSKGIDTERYNPIGAGFYAGYASSFHPSILCIDATLGTSENPHLVKIGFDKENFTKDDFFNLFKRMDVEFTLKHTSFREAQRGSIGVHEVNAGDLMGQTEE